MKTELQYKKELLAIIRAAAPSVYLSITATEDPSARWDIDDPELDPEDFQCWDHEVSAHCIADGEDISASDYLGGTWERYGDNPAQSNPMVSGYLPGMVDRALADLAQEPGVPIGIVRQIESARERVRAFAVEYRAAV